MNVTVLSGGVGGAKLVQGLAAVMDPGELQVIVNTADDIQLYGLHISPDVDIVTYTLAEVVDPSQGWGFADESFACLQQLKRFAEPWFTLGDRDLAVHLYRTQCLDSGMSLTGTTDRIRKALGVDVPLLPMSDDPVTTRIRSGTRELHLQEYMVKHQCRPPIDGIRYQGIEQAAATEAVLAAIEEADLIAFAPSNPVVSIGPMLSLPGLRAAIDASRAPVLGVSPIVAGQTVKGPADKMMRAEGYTVSAAGVARYYDGLLSGLVIDERDRSLKERIETMGIQVEVTDTIMNNLADRERLARHFLRVGESLV